LQAYLHLLCLRHAMNEVEFWLPQDAEGAGEMV
jgi:hypothetical protein